jgi:hypothetical protein
MEKQNHMENEIKTVTDEEVERMVETWDIVKCKVCRREVSMLDAESVNDGEYFICKGKSCL